MILPYEMQPYPDQIGEQRITDLAGIEWELTFQGTTHRDLDVFELYGDFGRTGRAYCKREVWLIVVDDWPGI